MRSHKCKTCDGTGWSVLNPNWPSGTEAHRDRCPDCDDDCSICGDPVYVEAGNEPGPHYRCQVEILEAALRTILRKRTLDNAKHVARAALEEADVE